MAHSEASYISTVQAAEALGVSVSTVKRWVDEGILPAHRTAGGHRKLLRPEVLALARRGDLPHTDLSRLVVESSTRKPVRIESLPAPLLHALVHGDAAEARGLVQRAYRTGIPLELLADQVISPVMQKVGHEWETERIDVWHEHRGTQICAAALHSLFAELGGRAERQRPVALGAGPAGDPYLLAGLLAQLVLLDAGWDSVQLGPNTPFPNLIKALRELQPRLVWLSVSYLVDEREFIREYREFYRVAERAGIPVAIGGRALSEPIRSQLPYTMYGDGLQQLAAFARTLHSRPAVPRRGRPHQGAR